jgi:thymidylate synthase (FAD)
MKIVQQSHEILTPPEHIAGMLKRIELCGRVCYKSEDRITDDSAERFVAMLIRRGHESVLEHEAITVRFVCGRGVSHELVRHRLASYSQESTRYCNYGDEIAVIDARPWLGSRVSVVTWETAMREAEMQYQHMIQDGATPQHARGVLPIDVKTEIVMSANLREWRYVFRLRCAKAAHPQIRALMTGLRDELAELLQVVFGGGE